MIQAKVFLLTLINNGSSSQFDFIKNKRIKLSNQIYLTVLFYCVPFAVLNLFFGYNVMFALNALNFFITVFCLFLSSKRKTDLGNALFLHSFIGSVLFYSLVLGVESRLDTLLIAIVSGVYTIYGSTKLKEVVYYLCLCAFTYLVMHYVDTFNFVAAFDTPVLYFNIISLMSFLVSGAACLLIPVLFDIENKKRESKLSLAKEETELLLEKKTKFFSMMSHEIRTPLHGIIGLSDLLTEVHSLPNDVKEKLNVINFSAKNLKNIVSDVLDYSKLEDGRLTISNSSFSLPQLINDIDTVQATRIEEKGLEFIENVSANLPEFIESDPFRITQVLNNLIDNAIKFTDKGSVTLNVLFESNSSSQGNLIIEIVDTGIGIPREEQASLFSAYTQISPVETRNFNGTGLGLAICKKIITQLGGKVELVSDDKQGTSVSFVLPVAVTPTSVVNTALEVVQSRDFTLLKGLTILQIEDNLVNQFVSIEVFKSLGIVYEVVSDSTEGLELLRTKKFDLVVMDYHMPEMNGYQVSEKIRIQEKELVIKEVPILIATADTEGSKKSNYINFGINGHILKPFVKNELFDRLQYYCQKLKVKPNKTNAYFENISFSEPQIDLAFIKRLVGEDVEIVNELIAMVRLSVPRAITAINLYKGKEVYSDDDIQDLITNVHNLKSNFRNVGAKQFADVLQIAEDALHNRVDKAIVWEAVELIEENLGFFITNEE
jgi:signal transduction histidine kinase/CheY-like chemotaxis protein